MNRQELPWERIPASESEGREQPIRTAFVSTISRTKLRYESWTEDSRQKALKVASGVVAGQNIASDDGSRKAESQQFDKKTYRLAPDQYFPIGQRKDLIVLHFTAGTSSDSAYKTWRDSPDRIATAYGVDPDGSIAEFFPPECWAYHLGVKGTSVHDKRSIGIEIANVGPLKIAADNPRQLNWWPRDWGTRFCERDESHRYVQSTYRGIDFFAAMPECQQVAVGRLVGHLSEQFRIPRVINGSARSGEFDLNGFANYSGVASHANFRRDKWDVGPAFNWEYLGF